MAIVNSYDGGVPTPDRTSLDAIVSAARELLEIDGLPGVTMQAVATAVGVRAPSLYKRVPNREELIRLVAESGLRDLMARLEPVETGREAVGRIRAFAHEHPGVFRLVMAPGPGVPTVSREANLASSATILRLASETAGPAHALEAARTVTAWATGFIIMELNNGFRLDGDVDKAWEYGCGRIFAAVAADRPRGSAPTASGVGASR